TETILPVPLGPSAASAREAFQGLFRNRFGHDYEGRALELVDVSVRARQVRASQPTFVAHAGSGAPQPLRRARWYLDGAWLEDVPVYARESLGMGEKLLGPAIVAEEIGTIALEPGFELRAEPGGLLRVTPLFFAAAHAELTSQADSRPDPVELEIYA